MVFRTLFEYELDGFELELPGLQTPKHPSEAATLLFSPRQVPQPSTPTPSATPQQCLRPRLQTGCLTLNPSGAGASALLRAAYSRHASAWQTYSEWLQNVLGRSFKIEKSLISTILIFHRIGIYHNFPKVLELSGSSLPRLGRSNLKSV
jgi:hypothetical protein